MSCLIASQLSPRGRSARPVADGGEDIGILDPADGEGARLELGEELIEDRAGDGGLGLEELDGLGVRRGGEEELGHLEKRSVLSAQSGGVRRRG